MNKKILALLSAVLMLLSLTACNTTEPAQPPTESTAPTEPTEPETAPVLSQVQWMVNEPFDTCTQWDIQFDETSNTLTITGENYDTREIQFYEGCNQVQLETCLLDDGTVSSQKEYDEQGNLIYELDDYGYRTVYTYEDGIVTTETVYYEDSSDPVIVTTWVYDDMGRKSSYTEHEDDQVTHYETWTYDDAGFCVYRYQESGYLDETWYEHENFIYQDGFLVKSIHQGSDPSNAWDYSVTYRYDEQGRTVSALNTDEYSGDAEDLWEFDSEGRVTKSVTHYNMDGWVAVTSEYKYNAAGQPVWEHFQEVYLPDNDFFYCDDLQYTYDSDGRLTQRKCIDMDGNEHLNNYTYDSMGNLTMYDIVYNTELQYYLTCEYDSDGNRIAVDRNGENELTGDEILLITDEEDDAEIYVAGQYENTANAQEAEAVNAFILQYIRNYY